MADKETPKRVKPVTRKTLDELIAWLQAHDITSTQEYRHNNTTAVIYGPEDERTVEVFDCATGENVDG